EYYCQSNDISLNVLF
nr:immunoglobulin light chain junction region [Macaca mulatta]